jgi:hypothetical protein
MRDVCWLGGSWVSGANMGLRASGDCAHPTCQSLGNAKSPLGDAESSLGDVKSSLGDAKSSLGDAESSLGEVKS